MRPCIQSVATFSWIAGVMASRLPTILMIAAAFAEGNASKISLLCWHDVQSSFSIQQCDGFST